MCVFLSWSQFEAFSAHRGPSSHIDKSKDCISQVLDRLKVIIILIICRVTMIKLPLTGYVLWCSEHLVELVRTEEL